MKGNDTKEYRTKKNKENDIHNESKKEQIDPKAWMYDLSKARDEQDMDKIEQFIDLDMEAFFNEEADRYNMDDVTEAQLKNRFTKE